MLVRIFVFIAIAAVIGVALHLGLETDTERIILFVVAVLVLAIAFPLRRGVLEKEWVDLLYYSAGILVAAALFLTKEIERKRLELSQQIADLNRQTVGIDAEIASFDYLASNVPLIVATINLKVDKQLGDLDSLAAQVCTCFRFGPVAGGRCGNSLALPTAPRDHSLFDPEQQFRRIELEPQCELMEGMLRDAERVGSSARDYAEIKRIIQLVGVPTSIPIGDLNVPVSRAVELIDHIQQQGTSDRDAMVERRNIAERQRADLGIKIKGLGVGERTGQVLKAAEFAEFYWPYILISFLGLKIARVGYVEKLLRTIRP
jgi:hypothetical protein